MLSSSNKTPASLASMQPPWFTSSFLPLSPLSPQRTLTGQVIIWLPENNLDWSFLEMPFQAALVSLNISTILWNIRDLWISTEPDFWIVGWLIDQWMCLYRYCISLYSGFILLIMKRLCLLKQMSLRAKRILKVVFPLFGNAKVF